MKKINLYAFADEASPQLDGQIEALKKNGLDGLEIRNINGASVSEIPLEKAREIKSRLDAEGLAVWSVGSPIGKIHIQEDDFRVHTEAFKHTLEIARILDSRNIRVFSFYMPEGGAERCKNEVIDRLGSLCEMAKGFGIRLCHENEKGIYGDIPERCLALHQALPELGGVFDPANFVQCGVDTRQAWELLKDFVCYMHIKDAKRDGWVVPAGMGDGNLPFLLGEYRKNGGSCVTLEPHLAVFDGLAKLERETDQSMVHGGVYRSNMEAFEAAAQALKKLLEG